MAFEQHSCGQTHAGVCNKISHITQLGHGVGGFELRTDNDSERVLHAGHERNHAEQEEHDDDGQHIALLLLFSHRGIDLRTKEYDDVGAYSDCPCEGCGCRRDRLAYQTACRH